MVFAFFMQLGLPCYEYVYHVSSTFAIIMHHILPCLFIIINMFTHYVMLMHNFIILLLCACVNILCLHLFVMVDLKWYKFLESIVLN